MIEGAAVNVEGLWAGCPSRTQDEELPFVSSRESVPAQKPSFLWGFCMPWQQGCAGYEKEFKLGGMRGDSGQVVRRESDFPLNVC